MATNEDKPAKAQAPSASSAKGGSDATGTRLDLEGTRPATGTPPQVVEAGPGVEVDADLDRASVRKASSGAVEDASDADLLKAAQAKAPRLTAEFVSQYGLEREVLEGIANGSVPPPPTPGPIHSADMHYTPGGWQQTPVGVPPEDVGKNAVHNH
jgi:hypothetical protein